MNNRQAYTLGIETLTSAGIKEAKTDTLLLLYYLCHINHNDIFAHSDELIKEDEEKQFRDALKKRSNHVPVQQITGKQEFMGLEFHVNEHVLIPRQDTEILVEEVLKELQDGYQILDMCTGSGCILLSLLHYSNDCIGIGADISKQAIDVARENAKVLNINATFIESNLFEKIYGRFDIIVSNPPYIRSDIIPTLMEEVKDFEPLIALDGREDGLFFYHQIIDNSKEYLNNGGKLFFEIGYDQGKAVGDYMKKNGFKDVSVVKDYSLLDRIVFGTLIGGNTDV